MARRYFSQRTGEAPDSISLGDFACKFNIVFNNFVKDGYFKQIGIVNPISDLSNTDDHNRLERKLAMEFGLRGKKMIPTTENIMKLDRSSLFDLIEFLADHVSRHDIRDTRNVFDKDIFDDMSRRRPVSVVPSTDLFVRRFLGTYDSDEGRKKWRGTLNIHLKQLELPCKLTEKQEIETLPSSDGLRHLVDNCTSSSEDEQTRVKHACRLFLKHGATKDDKRNALNDLASVLEPMQHDLKKIAPKEKNDLFNIVNNYGIRHNNDRQKKCDEIYLQWIFYSLLAAIDLTTKLRTHES